MTYISNRAKSQRDQIRDDLIAGKTITPIDALEKYGCYRLAARIGESVRLLSTTLSPSSSAVRK